MVPAMGAEDSENSPSDLEARGDDSSTDDETTQVDLASSSSDSERESVPSSTTESDKDTSQSIEDMLLEFDEQEGLIRDRSLLDPNYVVEEDRIVGRDEQLQKVTKMLRVALGNNRPPNLFLYGPSGTGKSLITKAVWYNISRICESRDIQFGTIEVNCQDLDTLGVAVYELASQAADEADVEIDVPKQSLS
jgi:cell division control protein 6